MLKDEDNRWMEMNWSEMNGNEWKWTELNWNEMNDDVKNSSGMVKNETGPWWMMVSIDQTWFGRESFLCIWQDQLDGDETDEIFTRLTWMIGAKYIQIIIPGGNGGPWTTG